MVRVNIEKFVLFHKRRIDLLKNLLKEKKYGRLIFQICFLGFESLAKLLFLKEKYPAKRFISLLSIPNNGINKKEAEKLYKFWRCSLVHQGFIAEPWTTLEGWDEEDVSFLVFPDRFKSSVEFSPEVMILIYNSRIDYLEEFFKEKNIKEIKIN